MDRGVYEAVLEKMTIPLSATPHFRVIAQLFGVSIDTVYSIYSQEVQARVIRTHHQLKASSAAYAQRYLAGGGRVLRHHCPWPSTRCTLDAHRPCS
jgi:hypothetical protein